MANRFNYAIITPKYIELEQFGLLLGSSCLNLLRPGNIEEIFNSARKKMYIVLF